MNEILYRRWHGETLIEISWEAGVKIVLLARDPKESVEVDLSKQFNETNGDIKNRVDCIRFSNLVVGTIENIQRNRGGYLVLLVKGMNKNDSQ